MRLGEDFLSELRMRCDIESLISSYITLNRRGSNLVGLCPFHNEKTGSFTVYTNTNSFYCFGCGAGGDAITFVQRAENLSYIDAVKSLADRVGLAMPEDGYDDSMQKLRMKVLEANRAAAKYYHSVLLSPDGQKGLKYLTDRQLSKKTITRFGLGFAPNQWSGLYDHLRAAGFSDSVLLQADLIVKRKSGKGYYDRFRNRVMFPIIDLRGNVIAFGGRKMPDDESNAKYINTSDTPVYKKSNTVFALNFAKNSNRKGLILCEGYMDVIAMHQAGVDNAVAACGTSFTAQQARLLTRYRDEIILMLDADAAGEKATNRAIEILNTVTSNIRVVRLPGAKDPDEYIKQNGAEKFTALVDGASNDIEYKLLAAKAKYDITTDNGRLRFLREASRVLASVNDRIARELYASRLATEQGISRDTLLREINTLIKQNSAKDRKAQQNKVISGGQSMRIDVQKSQNLRANSAEELLLAALLQSPKLYDKMENALYEDDFVTDFNKRVYSKTVEIIKEGRIPEIGFYSSDFTPEEMGRIVEFFNRPSASRAGDKEITDCMRVIKEEKSRIVTSNLTQMGEDEWAANVQKLADKKRGNANG